MSIFTKRAYEEYDPGDGYRVLVDRLWPRGISKEHAGIDEWLKEAAPSEELRKRYHEGSIGWSDFRRLYLHMLAPPRTRRI